MEPGGAKLPSVSNEIPARGYLRDRMGYATPGYRGRFGPIGHLSEARSLHGVNAHASLRGDSLEIRQRSGALPRAAFSGRGAG